MAVTLTLDAAAARPLIGRLRRIEGQIRGLQRMVAEARDCTEIARQVAAARARERLQQTVLILR
jgi:DNA-binding FrmR family transcriptional regulator